MTSGCVEYKRPLFITKSPICLPIFPEFQTLYHFLLPGPFTKILTRVPYTNRAKIHNLDANGKWKHHLGNLETFSSVFSAQNTNTHPRHRVIITAALPILIVISFYLPHSPFYSSPGSKLCDTFKSSRRFSTCFPSSKIQKYTKSLPCSFMIL